MGFFSRLGNRISSGLHSAARVGKKVLGSVSRVGTRIADGAEKVVNVVERVPILGQVAAPITGVVRSGVGLVRDVADAASAGKKLIEEGEDVLKSGDLSKVGALAKKGKSQLEKGGRIAGDTQQLLKDVQKLSKDVSARQMGKDAVRLGRDEAKRRMGM